MEPRLPPPQVGICEIVSITASQKTPEEGLLSLASPPSVPVSPTVFRMEPPCVNRVRKNAQEPFFWQRMAPPHEGKSMAWVPLWRGATPCERLFPQPVCGQM
jgi:hypothetical protein